MRTGAPARRPILCATAAGFELDSLSDAELARRIAAHDQHAFVLLMRRHNQLLYRTARSILRDDADAEDALQDAYLQAYRAIGQFRGNARLATWLTRYRGPIVSRHTLLGATLVLAGAAASAASTAAPDLKLGQTVYARCTACHSFAYDKVGPRHCGLFGRRAGSVPGFAYSAAMKYGSECHDAM